MVMASSGLIGGFGTSGSIALGNVSTGSVEDGFNVTFSHTVSNNANRLLLVLLTKRNFDVTADVSFSGSPLTLSGSSAAGDGDFPRSEIWYFLDPPIITGNITIDFNTADWAQAVGVDWYGVNQITPLGTSASASALGVTDLSVLPDGATGNVSIGVAGTWNADFVLAPYATQTLVGKKSSDTRWQCHVCSRNWDGITGLGWTILSNSNMALTGVSIKGLS
jgi:hypothetical protein